MKHDRIIRISKFLSLVLRHQPGKIGLNLDANGWADVAELMEKSAAHGMPFDLDTLKQVVETNSKKRFAFHEDGTRIRASQGHSIDIDLELQPQTPPEILYHGTAQTTLNAIRESGLLAMSRQHVHLSGDEETAVRVGSRHGKAVVLKVRAGELARQGHAFFQSANGVWLTAAVPCDFLEFPG